MGEYESERVHAQACSRPITAFSSGKPGSPGGISWEEPPARDPLMGLHCVSAWYRSLFPQNQRALHRAVCVVRGVGPQKFRVGHGWGLLSGPTWPSQ